MPQLVSIHQPNYMLWVKLLDKILASDVYIAYDSVQYTKREFHSRQKIKRATGPEWLSVPVLHHGQPNIEDIHINKNNPDFRRKHLGILFQEYRRAKFYGDVYPIVEEVYARDHELLVDLNLDLIAAFLAYLGSDTRIVRASSLAHEGDNTERLIALIRNAGGETHLTSTYGTDRQYVDWHRLQAAGIPIYSQEFEHPTYGQLWGGDFVPHLSALDMLFCCGPETKTILDARRRLVAVPEQKG